MGFDLRFHISNTQRQQGRQAEAPSWDEASLTRVHQVPDKARRVQAMFDAIVPRYELVNTLTTLGLDATWRRRLAKVLVLPPGAQVLDIACGTGQVLKAIHRYQPQGTRLWGLDFSAGMIRQAKQQVPASVRLLQGDATYLPFWEGSFDAVTCVFGVRNFADPQAGLAEMRRVLRPGGMLGILEFSMPRAAVVAGLYKVYFRWVLPRLASWLSGDSGGAYRYLQKSVEAFSQEVDLRDRLLRCGLERVQVQTLTFGVVQLYTAFRPTGERA